MKKSKAVFVTSLMAVMLAVIWACLWKISTIGFAVMTAIFAVLGFAFGIAAFGGWLAKAPAVPVDKLDLPDLSEETLEPPIIDELTYDAIREEVASL